MQEQEQSTHIEPEGLGDEMQEQEAVEQALERPAGSQSGEATVVFVEEDQGSLANEEQEDIELDATNGVDKLALFLVVGIAAFFALVARFNSQPAPSFIPAAVLSATGCGLLVTAVRKLRTIKGPGLFEAAVGGFCLALLQFAVALTYPGLFSSLNATPGATGGFLLTWGLVALFSMLLSLIGATLGHLAFAPLRPLEAKASAGVSQKAAASTTDESDDDEEAESESQRAEMERVVASSTGEEDEGEAVQGVVAAEEAEEGAAQEQTEAREATAVRPSLLNYLIAIILLGFCPLISGYVFAAAYDFAMSLINANAIEPGIYPTLSLLGGLLPWRLAAPISLSGANGSFIVSALLWRIPDSFLGNPSTFDIQTLEALVFNATGLALLLLTMYGRERSSHKAQAAPWSLFCIFEFIFGFFLILPANLWLFQGLEGILQIEGQTVALPTVHFLNTTLFLLNLITGSLFCLLIGLIVRRQYTLWTQPRAGSVASADAQS